VNDAPVGNNDTATTAEDTTVSNIDVLGNDTDVDGDTLTVSGTPTAANGSVTVNPDGSLNYTPNAGFIGTDTIIYTVTDGLLTQTSTVSVTVTAGTPPTGGLFDPTSYPSTNNLPPVTQGLSPELGVSGLESGRSVVNAVREIGDLGYLSDISGSDRVVLRTTEQIESLNPVSGVNDNRAFIIQAVNRVDQSITFEQFVNGRYIEEGKFTANDFTGFSVRWSLAGGDPAQGLDSAMLHVLASDSTIILQIMEIVDGGNQIGVQDYSLTMADGRAVPDWLVKGEKGLVFAELPADIKSIDIKLSIILENGDTMTGLFTIQAGTGEISEMAPDSLPGQSASLFSDQLSQTAQQQNEGFVNLAEALSQN
ncbi:T1SS secreted agglutinin RTX, partial [hydrothermal vent metagenome]